MPHGFPGEYFDTSEDVLHISHRSVSMSHPQELTLKVSPDALTPVGVATRMLPALAFSSNLRLGSAFGGSQPTSESP
jgi:hypothetical protein